MSRNLAAVQRRLRLARPVPPAARRLWLEPSLWRAVLVLVVVATFFTAYGLDAAAVPWRQGLPHGLRDNFQRLTRFGKSDWVLIPTGVFVIVLLLGDWTRIAPRFRAAWAEVGIFAAYVFFAVATSGIVTNILKQIVGRARPMHFEDRGWLAFSPFNFDYGYVSFPSGHATTAGALMVCGILLLPRWRIAFVVFALLIGLSRVAVGAHYPSDVVAGLAVGSVTALALAFMLARRGYGFSFAPDGTLRRKPTIVGHLVHRRGAPMRWLGALPRALALPARRKAPPSA